MCSFASVIPFLLFKEAVVGKPFLGFLSSSTSESHKYGIGPQGKVPEMLKMSCQISSIWNLNAIKNMGLMKCNGGTSWFGNGGEARCQMHRCTISLLTSTWCTLHTLLMYHLPFTSVWYSGNTILLNYSVFVLLQCVSFFQTFLLYSLHPCFWYLFYWCIVSLLRSISCTFLQRFLYWYIISIQPAFSKKR